MAETPCSGLLLLNILVTSTKSLSCTCWHQHTCTLAFSLLHAVYLLARPARQTAYDISMTHGVSLNAFVMYSFNCAATHDPGNEELKEQRGWVLWGCTGAGILMSVKIFFPPSISCYDITFFNSKLMLMKLLKASQPLKDFWSLMLLCSSTLTL